MCTYNHDFKSQNPGVSNVNNTKLTEEIESLGRNKGWFFKYFKITFMHLLLPKKGYILDEIPFKKRSNAPPLRQSRDHTTSTTNTQTDIV